MKRLWPIFAVVGIAAWYFLRKKPDAAPDTESTTTPTTGSTGSLVTTVNQPAAPSDPAPDQSQLIGKAVLSPDSGPAVGNTVSLSVLPNTNGYVDLSNNLPAGAPAPSASLKLDAAIFTRIAVESLAVPLEITVPNGNTDIFIRHVSPNQQVASAWERHSYYS
jgi:hypothetical protein